MSEETQTQTQEVVAAPVVSVNVDKAKALFDAFYTNVTKLYTKGTASAGARARKNASELSKLFKVVRKDIQVVKRANAADKKARKASSTPAA